MGQYTLTFPGENQAVVSENNVTYHILIFTIPTKSSKEHQRLNLAWQRIIRCCLLGRTTLLAHRGGQAIVSPTLAFSISHWEFPQGTERNRWGATIASPLSKMLPFVDGEQCFLSNQDYFKTSQNKNLSFCWWQSGAECLGQDRPQDTGSLCLSRLIPECPQRHWTLPRFRRSCLVTEADHCIIKASREIPQSVSIGLSHGPAIASLGYTQRNQKQRLNTCTTMSIVALFAKAKRWKQPASISWWTNKQHVANACSG